MRPLRATTAVLLLTLVAVGCGGGNGDEAGDSNGEVPVTEAAPAATTQGTAGPPALLAIVSPATGARIAGNVVSLDVTSSGIRIVAPDGDVSGRTGHYHAFVDRDPVGPGEQIPVGEGIIHAADEPILIPGLGVGEHRVSVVYGDGAHNRIGVTEAGTSFTVTGPSIQASAPTSVAAGEPVEISVAVDGLDEGTRLHVVVDGDAPVPGEILPGQATAARGRTTSITLPALEQGSHVLWVVAASADDSAAGPLVADRVAVEVGP